MSTGTNDGALAGLDRSLRDTFGWYTVAKKEFKDAIRSRGLLMLAVIFTVAFIAPVAGALWFGIGAGSSRQAELLQQQGMQFLLSSIYLTLVTFLLPVVAIFVGYASITKERTSGSLKLLLSLPHSRKDVIIGKVLGRCGVLGVPLAVSLALTAVFLAASQLTFKPVLFGLFGLFTLVFGLVFVAITVSISGVFEKSSWSGIANFIVYFFFTFVWSPFTNGFSNILGNDLGITGPIRWHLTLLLKLVNPNAAYKTLVNSILADTESSALSARFSMFGRGSDQEAVCGGVLNGSPEVQQSLFGNMTTCQPGQAGIPFIYSDPAVLVYMLAWIGVAAAISYYTFAKADL